MTQTTNPPETDTDNDTETPDEQPKLQLSATQLAASSLAAVTSALIGAQLGVAGTLIGAAVGSLVAGIASAMYTMSLQRTQRRLSAIAKTTKGGASTPKRTLAPGAASRAPEPETLGDRPDSELLGTSTGESDAGTRRRPWKVLVATAVAAFVLGLLALTLFEAATGKAVSGGSGTTISQVRERTSTTTEEEATPSDVPGDVGETPTEEPTGIGGTTEEPTEDPTTIPTEDPTTIPTEDPTTTPTEDPTTEVPAPAPTEDPTGAVDPGTDTTDR